ncbi:phosphatase PAP2 family protein [Patescibacteria group bacterium]|nr:phosphatase PAP2 family protein [Patescibacteria group bacterium]MBU1890574.1 phosphatase PAP2 family protein [Patescibacteria group bacterium]
MKNPLGCFKLCSTAGTPAYKNVLFVGYIVLVVLLIVFGRLSFSYDSVLVILLGLILFIKRSKQFVVDWSPFLIIVLAYGMMRGLADNLASRVHITDIISWERWLFGSIPTLEFQAWLHPSDILHWYDYMFGAFYTSFYIFPLIVAFVLWLKRRDYFKFFMYGILFLTMMGYLTYIIFPAMPPWLASQEGHLPEVTKILDEATNKAVGIDIPVVYDFLGANLIAAMPSIHAAWPWYTLLCLVFFYKKKGLWFVIMPLVIWFGVVYLGEHYIIDVIAGIIYASVAYFVVYKLRHRIIKKLTIL